MKYLLDTHIWLWSLLEPDRLTARVRRALESQESELWISAISIWEALVLADKGRLELLPEPETWLTNAMQRAPFKEVPVTIDVAVQSRTVQLPHRDPADRFIAASARVFGLTLVTADQRLLKCKGISVLANR
jgi:PIN domain nuclease of toxin-antitoxin system